MTRKKFEAVAPDMLAGRTVFITCGAPGVGERTARLFAQAGAAVAVSVRAGGAAALETALAGSKHLVLTRDLRDEGQVVRAFAEIEDKLGAVDTLVCFSDFARRGALGDLTADDWDEMAAKQLRPAFLCAKAAAPAMKAAGFGKMVFVSSAAAKVGGVPLDLGVHYAAAAGGLLGLARGLAMELAPHGINVNAICPTMSPSRKGR